MNAAIPGVAVPGVAVDALPDDAVLLDVREDDEWAAGHAPDAHHLPMSGLGTRVGDVPEADPLYVICRSGARSAQVVAYLNQRGRVSVNVEGGMRAWAGRGRPILAEGPGVPEIV